MKCKVTKPCFIGGSRRRVGDTVEWEGAKVPSCFAVIEAAPKGRSPEVHTEEPAPKAKRGKKAKEDSPEVQTEEVLTEESAPPPVSEGDSDA